VDVHASNRFTKDVAVFAEARVYFSNEEDKFGDDRAVDFAATADGIDEAARNVTIDLDGQHGRFVMMQLFYAAKWILISEVTFSSRPYESHLVAGATEEPARQPPQPPLAGEKPMDTSVLVPPHQPPPREPPPHHGNGDAGVVIGALLAVILILLAAIFYVGVRGRGASGVKGGPTHSLLLTRRKFNVDDVKSGLYYEDPVSSSCPPTQETIYEEPLRGRLYASSGFLSLNRKFGSDPALSEDGCETGDYAEPEPVSANTSNAGRLPNSNSCDDNVYAKAAAPPSPTSAARRLIKPLPLAHYARPMTPTVARPRPEPPISARVSPPAYASVAVLPSPAHRRGLSRSATASSGASVSPASSCRPRPIDDLGTETEEELLAAGFYASADVFAAVAHSSSPAPVGFFSRSASADTMASCAAAPPPEVNREWLRPVEKLGEGTFGEVHVCELADESNNNPPRLVAVKTLRRGCGPAARAAFEQEARALTALADPNLVSVVGVCTTDEPLAMVCEFWPKDLWQYLQDHVAETSLSRSSPGVATLR